MSFDKLMASANNIIAKQLGFESTSQVFGGLQNGEPWFNSPDDDAFFNPIKIDTKRWDKFYPYRLLVIDITNNKIYGGGATRFVNKLSIYDSIGSKNGIEYALQQAPLNGSWELRLPISPQQLTITDQFAINTTATMRGVVEEHNGVKFKMIQAQGTTGIWAQKPTIAGEFKSPTIIGSLAANTLEAVGQTLGGVSRLLNAFQQKYPVTARKEQSPGDHPSTLYSTGYYQALFLAQFLERYSQLKKNPSNKNLRLIFDMPKNNESYVVTPQGFSLQKSANKPNEFFYNLQLKAWKRIQLESPASASTKLPEISLNVIQAINNTIREARRTLALATNVLKAVRNDIQGPFNTIREFSLVIKDLGQFAFTAADLPKQVVQDIKSALKQASLNLKSSFKRGPAGRSNALSVTSASARAGSNQARTAFAIDVIEQESYQNEGITNDQVTDGNLGQSALQDQQTNLTNQIFENPEEFYELFDNLPIEQLQLTPQQQEIVDNALITPVQIVTVDTLLQWTEEIQTLTSDLSDYFGASDATYAQIYNKPKPRKRVLKLTIEEQEIIYALYQVIQSLQTLTATRFYDDLKLVNNLEFVGGLASESDINLQQSPSKYLVPVPFNLNIEQIAARYLNDSNRWLEIATLNNLSSPYIDEDGFFYDLLSNASGRRFNVNDRERRLYIGQKILLSSTTVKPFTRKITNIEKISDTNYLITVDGLDNLSTLTTIQKAKIQGYRPNTVNSQNQIYIPSDLPAEEDDRVRIPDHLAEDKLTRISKIDFLMTDEGDIALNSLGDVRLANGLTNLIQALKIKIKTEKGTLLRHLDFGLGINVGVNIADIENGTLYQSMEKMVQDDPRFLGLEKAIFRISEGSLLIEMVVKVANGSGVIPINFNVKI